MTDETSSADYTWSVLADGLGMFTSEVIDPDGYRHQVKGRVPVEPRSSEWLAPATSKPSRLFYSAFEARHAALQLIVALKAKAKWPAKDTVIDSGSA